jgi:hypothetical protein
MKKFFINLFGIFYTNAESWFSRPPTLIKTRRNVAWVYLFGMATTGAIWLWVVLR